MKGITNSELFSLLALARVVRNNTKYKPNLLNYPSKRAKKIAEALLGGKIDNDILVDLQAIKDW